MPRYSITPRLVTHNHKPYWRVITPVDLGGGKQYFPIPNGATKKDIADIKKEADAHCADLLKRRQKGPSRLAGLSHEVQSAILLALDELGDGNGTQILEAVKFWKKNNARESRKLADAIADCLAAKKASGCRHRYLVALKNTLKRFRDALLLKLPANQADVVVHEITMRECEAWINQDALSAATRRSRQIDLGTFFSFCLKRGYCVNNPTTGLERHKFDDRPPGIFSPQDCDTLLAWCDDQYPDMLAALVLMLFGGLRPYEAYKMRWEDLRGREIVMDGKNTKTRSRRIVKINDTLHAWLAYCWESGRGELPPPDGPRNMTRVRVVVPKWIQDGLRHSYVSYSYELHGEIETAKQAGHSVDMLLKHYRALTDRQTAERFWAILPEFATMKKENL